jgi:hypothetical protein
MVLGYTYIAAAPVWVAAGVVLLAVVAWYWAIGRLLGVIRERYAEQWVRLGSPSFREVSSLRWYRSTLRNYIKSGTYQELRDPEVGRLVKIMRWSWWVNIVAFAAGLVAARIWPGHTYP